MAQNGYNGNSSPKAGYQHPHLMLTEFTVTPMTRGQRGTYPSGVLTFYRTIVNKSSGTGCLFSVFNERSKHKRLKRTHINSETDNTKRMFSSCLFCSVYKSEEAFFLTFLRGLILFQSSLVSDFFGFFNVI